MAFAKKIETKFVRFLYRKLEKKCIRNFTGSIQIAKQIQLKFDSTRSYVLHFHEIYFLKLVPVFRSKM